MVHRGDITRGHAACGRAHLLPSSRWNSQGTQALDSAPITKGVILRLLEYLCQGEEVLAACSTMTGHRQKRTLRVNQRIGGMTTEANPAPGPRGCPLGVATILKKAGVNLQLFGRTVVKLTEPYTAVASERMSRGSHHQRGVLFPL